MEAGKRASHISDKCSEQTVNNGSIYKSNRRWSKCIFLWFFIPPPPVSRPGVWGPVSCGERGKGGKGRNREKKEGGRETGGEGEIEDKG